MKADISVHTSKTKGRGGGTSITEHREYLPTPDGPDELTIYGFDHLTYHIITQNLL